jgi:hypothetical protein
MFERAKTFHALHRAATVIGFLTLVEENIQINKGATSLSGLSDVCLKIILSVWTVPRKYEV